jgi:DNA-binding transcriptional ArsR family regulator
MLRYMQPFERLPVFRSETQRRLLVELFFDQSERRTLSDLARAIDVDPTTVMREVDRLAPSGLIIEERIGRARAVQIDPSSPYATPLRQLLGIERRPQGSDRDEPAGHGPRIGRHDRRPLPSSRQQP